MSRHERTQLRQWGGRSGRGQAAACSAQRIPPGLRGAAVLLTVFVSTWVGAADAPAPAPAPTPAPTVTPAQAAPAPATAPALTPDSAPDSAPVALSAAAASRRVVCDNLDNAKVGDWVEYRVGVLSAPGVETRANYRIRYDLLVVRPNEVTLARTSLTLEGRTLAREVFPVKRYPQVEPATPHGEESGPTRPATTAVSVTVAGRTIACVTVTDAVRENGLAKKLEWALSREVPLTGLVYEKVNGVAALQLIGFGRAVDAPPAATQPAATQPAPETIVIEPVLTDKPLPLEGDEDPAH